MTTIVAGRSEPRAVLEEPGTPLPHLAVEQITPPAVVLTPGLVPRRALRVDGNPSIIKTGSRWGVDLAPLQLKGLAQGVGAWLAPRAIRASSRRHAAKRVRHRSPHTPHVVLGTGYQDTAPGP